RKASARMRLVCPGNPLCDPGLTLRSRDHRLRVEVEIARGVALGPPMPSIHRVDALFPDSSLRLGGEGGVSRHPKGSSASDHDRWDAGNTPGLLDERSASPQAF